MSFYSTTVLADNPIFYARLNEAAYKIADSSGNNHHAAQAAAGVTYGAGSLVSNSDTALTFNGTTGLLVGPAFSIPLGTSAFSIECWASWASTPGHNYVFVSLGDWSGTSGAYVAVSTANKPFCGNQTNPSAVGASALSTGTPHHFVATCDGTTTKLYVDGTLINSGSYSTNITGGKVYIGGVQPGGATFYAGATIGQVAVYNYVLTSTQVSNHHGATGSGYDAAILADTPVSYWKLNDSANGSTAIVDSSTNATNATQAFGMASAPTLLTGDTDTSYFFGGINGATLPTTHLPTVNAAWSIEAWIKVAQYPGNANGAAIVSWGNWNSTKRNAFIALQHAGGVNAGTFSGDTAVSSAISLNARHHVVGTWDGTTLKCYLDGSLTASATPGALNVATGGAQIGAAPDGTLPFSGDIDEVAIYSAALTSTQVLTHYNAGADPILHAAGTISMGGLTVTGRALGSNVVAPLPVYALYVRNNSTGDLVDTLDDYIELGAVLNFNGISQLIASLDANSIHTPSALPDSSLNYPLGLILTRDNQDGNGPQPLFTGPITHMTYDYDASSNPPYSIMITADSDDSDLLVGLALPDTDESFATNAYDTRTGVVSTIMHDYVLYNIGASAHAERVISNLVLDADPAVGGTQTEAVRFNTLLEVLQNLSLRASTELGFQVQQPLTSKQKHFTIYQPRNQESVAIFSRAIGNVSRIHWQIDQPTANVAYEGGAGSGTSRLFTIRSNSASISRWGRRIEKFYNHSNLSVLADLQNQGDADLAADADVFALGVEIVESDGCVFLRNWKLGDLVTIAVDLPGQDTPILIQDVVRQVLISLKKGQRDVVQPVIGAPGALHPLTINRALHKIINKTQKQVTTLTVNQ